MKLISLYAVLEAIGLQRSQREVTGGHGVHRVSGPSDYARLFDSRDGLVEAVVLVFVNDALRILSGQ